MPEVQPRYSRGAAEIQPKCSRDTAEVQPYSPSHLEPAEPHQLDDVPLLVSPDRPALVELLEERAVRGRGVEHLRGRLPEKGPGKFPARCPAEGGVGHGVGGRTPAPLESLRELDVDRLCPVLAVRVPAQEADEQVERHLFTETGVKRGALHRARRAQVESGAPRRSERRRASGGRRRGSGALGRRRGATLRAGRSP